MQRGSELSIMLGANQLMNSRLSGSEVALATLACARTADRKERRILDRWIGDGLYLARGAGCGRRQGQIVVAELVPAVIAWARGPLSGIFENALDDPRVDLRQADVGDVIRSKNRPMTRSCSMSTTARKG